MADRGYCRSEPRLLCAGAAARQSGWGPRRDLLRRPSTGNCLFQHSSDQDTGSPTSSPGSEPNNRDYDNTLGPHWLKDFVGDQESDLDQLHACAIG